MLKCSRSSSELYISTVLSTTGEGKELHVNAGSNITLPLSGAIGPVAF